MSTGTGETDAKGLAAGGETILRIVKESYVLNEDELRGFEAWLHWLHDCERCDDEFLGLFVNELLPPILESANASVLFETIEEFPDIGIDAIRLLQLSTRSETLGRFNTLIGGLAERLLAPERGFTMQNQARGEVLQSRTRPTPQVT